MNIPFTKLHGAKNDFLLTWTKDAPSADLPALAVAICDRYTGVGADGWMLVDPTPGGTGDSAFDASIRLFNSDGSEPELSGNGTRCAAALLARTNPMSKEFRIRTGAGIKALELLNRTGNQYNFRMCMGAPKVLDANAIVQGRPAVLIDCGNPQCAYPVDSFDFDWQSLGAATEKDPRFPNRTNVSFVRKLSPNAIDVRFWERGAGLTNSSGTGSTGAAAAALALGTVTNPVQVHTPAGILEIQTDRGLFYLTGPAEYIAEGYYSPGAR